MVICLRTGGRSYPGENRCRRHRPPQKSGQRWKKQCSWIISFRLEKSAGGAVPGIAFRGHGHIGIGAVNVLKNLHNDGLLSVCWRTEPPPGMGNGNRSLLAVALGFPQDIGGRAVDVLEKVHRLNLLSWIWQNGPSAGAYFHAAYRRGIWRIL